MTLAHYLLQRGDALVAIEVKSGGRKQSLPGIAAFDKSHHPTAKFGIRIPWKFVCFLRTVVH